MPTVDIKSIETALAERDAAVAKKFEKMDDLERENSELRERVEHLEAKASAPGRPGGGSQSEHCKLFLDWVRKPRDHGANERLDNYQATKAVTVASGAGGGFAVPEEIGRQIEQMQLKLSPVRRLVKVSRAGTSDIKRLVDLTGAEGGWRSESGSASESNTPQLREITPTGGELYAYPKASNWSLEDVFFDVQGWLVDSVATKFAQLEGIAVISGTGSSQPTGLLNTTPVTTADDAVSPRAAAALQYINSGDNSPAAIDADSLIELVYTLNSAYRTGAAWAMNSTTAGQIRKLKDTTNQYLWQQGLISGQPSTLLGYPVEVWEQMPDVGGGNFPVGFGNFARAYELIDRSDITVTVDPFTTPGFTKFYVRRRVYGHVLNNDAVKVIRCL